MIRYRNTQQDTLKMLGVFERKRDDFDYEDA